MNRVQAVLLLDDLEVGVDELEATVLRWGERVEDLLAPLLPTEHVRITFRGDPPPIARETFRICGFTQEPGEAPVYVDEIIERGRPILGAQR